MDLDTLSHISDPNTDKCLVSKDVKQVYNSTALDLFIKTWPYTRSADSGGVKKRAGLSEVVPGGVDAEIKANKAGDRAEPGLSPALKTPLSVCLWRFLKGSSTHFRVNLQAASIRPSDLNSTS
ncbi:hypothetical protein SRHO_G00165020 [Serrasalmus rhombeus]